MFHPSFDPSCSLIIRPKCVFVRFDTLSRSSYSGTYVGPLPTPGDAVDVGVPRTATGPIEGMQDLFHLVMPCVSYRVSGVVLFAVWQFAVEQLGLLLCLQLSLNFVVCGSFSVMGDRSPGHGCLCFVVPYYPGNSTS